MSKKMKIGIVFLIPLLFVLLISVKDVSADSGWDTDYDSGSSWDSDYDSSWDNDNDSYSDRSYNSRSSYSSGSHDSSSSDINEFYLILIFIGFLFLKWVIKNYINDLRISRERRKLHSEDDEIYKYLATKEITNEEANSIISNFNIEEFKNKSYEIFIDIQKAWMYFEYDKLKELLTDELYNTYLMDLETLKIKNQKNIMSDFENISTKLIGIKKENNQYVATVLLNTKFYDYIEDNSGSIIRGNPRSKVNNIYILTFVKSVNEIKNNTCPKCGADVSGNVTGICDYCKTKITFNEYDWVMSEKKKIRQR